MLAGSRGASFFRVNTVPPEILNSEKLDAPSELERSKTEKHLPNAEKQRRNNILAEEAAQIFDDRISVQQKVRILFTVLQLALAFVLSCLISEFYVSLHHPVYL